MQNHRAIEVTEQVMTKGVIVRLPSVSMRVSKFTQGSELQERFGQFTADVSGVPVLLTQKIYLGDVVGENEVLKLSIPPKRSTWRWY